MTTTTLKKRGKAYKDQWRSYVKPKPKNEKLKRRCIGGCGEIFEARDRFDFQCDRCEKRDH